MKTLKIALATVALALAIPVVTPATAHADPKNDAIDVYVQCHAHALKQGVHLAVDAQSCPDEFDAAVALNGRAPVLAVARALDATIGPHKWGKE